MDRLLNDPGVMDQCAKLLANPAIMKQMSELLSNPEKIAALTDRFLNDSDKAARYSRGTKILIGGLDKHDLNGLVGVVVSHDKSTDRYIVQLEEPVSRQISVKHLNCETLDTSVAAFNS
jgi:hypothetical protein